MSKRPIILISFISLLAIGGVLVWKNKQGVDQSSEPEAAQTLDDNSARQSHNNPKKSQTRWGKLTDPSITWQLRVDMLRRAETLTRADAVELLALLNHTPASEADKEAWWTVLNEIMAQMRRQNIAPDQLGPALTAIVSDPSQSEVSRDYACQHLSQWLAPPTADTPGEPSAEAKAAALEAIAATITDPSIAQTSIPGTALMSLTANDQHLDPELIGPIWEKLDPVLTSILAGKTESTLATRTTVIQSVALRGSESHLPLIREYARDEKADPSIRLSSIAALGIYRSADDQQYLGEIANGNTRYRYAARSALQKFDTNAGR